MYLPSLTEVALLMLWMMLWYWHHGFVRILVVATTQTFFCCCTHMTRIRVVACARLMIVWAIMSVNPTISVVGIFFHHVGIWYVVGHISGVVGVSTLLLWWHTTPSKGTAAK